jgi:hypothetical protein
MDRIITSDIFKAMYLLNKKHRLYGVKQSNDGKKQFLIKGHNLHLHDFRYRTGHALMNPLVLKEIHSYLEKIDEDDQELLTHVCLLLSEEYYDSLDREGLIAL